MEFKLTELSVTLFLNLIHFIQCENIPSCNTTSLGPCPGDHIVCNGLSGKCVCDEGFSWDGEECISPDAAGGAGHGATLVVAVVFTLALLICGLVLIFRKYKLVDYITQKINARRNNDIMYEDVMIGQDDPPINP